MGGFFALLDDIAAFAKLTLSTVDDVAAAATKASAKSVGVIIDDTAVAPQYVQGISPKREIPTIVRIARGSVRNKLLFILPVALLLTWIAPWALPILLILGGTYLSFEGAEKVAGFFNLLKEEPDDTAVENTLGRSFEDRTVKKAITTDLVLSTEIMLIAMSEIHENEPIHRVLTLVLVALFMTLLVYGTVLVLIRMDDLGLKLVSHGETRRRPFVSRIGRGILAVMPKTFKTIGIVGTLAMIWVGGHIIIQSLHELGFSPLYNILETAAHSVPVPFVSWLIDTALSGAFGLALGSFVLLSSVFFMKLIKIMRLSGKEER